MPILVIQNKKEEKILRTPTRAFDFASRSKKELDALLQEMKKMMKEANGIGLSANQIGLARPQSWSPRSMA